MDDARHRPDDAELLRRLQSVTDAALAHLSLEELERDLLERLRVLLEGDVAMLLLTSSDDRSLCVHASSSKDAGFERHDERNIAIPMGRGLGGRIAAGLGPMVFEDLSQIEVLNPILQEKHICSLVGAPLRVEQRVIGVVYIGTARRRRFMPEDAHLVGLAGDRLGAAVERARLYEAVHEAEQRNAAILAAALDCIVTMDAEGRVTEFNPAAEKTFGYPREHAIGRSLGELIVPPALRARHAAGLARYLQTGEGPVLNKRIEISAVRADGSEFPVELTIVPLKMKGRPLFTGYLRDITDKKRSEAERERSLAREQAARAEAEAANRAKDDFLGVLSHELRTPLNPMLGWAQILSAQALDAATTKKGLDAITRNAKAQLRLVEDLLDISRIINGKLELTPEPIDLAAIVMAAMDVVRPSADAKSIRLRAQLEMVGARTSGDPSRLQQVIWNLLSNAIKFTPSGGRVDVELERRDGSLRLTVRDTGEGIAPEFLDHVFDRLRQADSSSTRRHGGLGLGLAIVRHLVEMHGGTVHAESEGLGRGATFVVELPVHEMDAPARAAAGVQQASRLDGCSVLLVDDDEDGRRLVTTLLEQAGARVTAVASADEAIAALASERPDVLVSDIAMPGMDGYELIRYVRGLEPRDGGTVPALALTAFTGRPELQRALADGYQLYVTKPVEPELLLRSVAQLACGPPS